MTELTVALQGLNCMGCARKVEAALNALPDTRVTTISPASVTVETSQPFSAITQAITGLGYQAGNQLTFQLSGLNCGRCVNKVSAALDETGQVSESEVTKTSLSLTTSLTESNVISLIESLGYQAYTGPAEPEQPETDNKQHTSPAQSTQEVLNQDALQLVIQGMTCASCVASVEKALKAVPGVSQVQVNLAEQSAMVWLEQTADEAVTEQLLEASQSAGYSAELVEDEQQLREKQQQKHQQSLKHFRRSSITALVLGIPLMGWGLVGGNMMIRSVSDQLIWGLIGLICLWLLATAGRHFFIGAWQSVLHRRATMDTLVALGTGAAWLYSMLVVVFPQWLPEASRHVYFEASAMIIGLISLGHYIEARAKANTSRSLQALIDLQPQTARVIENGQESDRPLSDVESGMLIRIRPGEKVPVDGEVIEGESYLDEAMLTGEPLPVLKQPGDKLAAGTINGDGSLVLKATSVGSNTVLARIIRLVRQAQSSKPQIARLADSISAVFVPVVIAIAIGSAAIWGLVGPEPKVSYMLVVATTVLIIACPCALGLATPLSVTAGVGKAAELGILIRDAEVLQSASKVNTVVFDKTGTLTQGQPAVQDLAIQDSEKREILLGEIYAAQSRSEHPLAKAICDYSQAYKSEQTVSEFSAIRGKGITATVGENHLVIGNQALMTEYGIDTTVMKSQAQQYHQQAFTAVYVAKNGKLAAALAIADTVKADAYKAVKQLKTQGIHVVMLTGDHQTVAEVVGNQLGIDQVIAGVLPDQKAEHIENLHQQGKTIAMVGDGINDAPALALADIGIAMGSGSDVAIESAQMTILNSSPAAVSDAIELSKATVKNMKQNLLGAFIYNSLGIPVAAGALYPWFGFLLSPVVAGAAMALSSITVVSNANRLRLFKTSTQRGE